MRDISHHLAVAVPQATRHGDMLDPDKGEVQAHVAPGDRALLDRAFIIPTMG